MIIDDIVSVRIINAPGLTIYKVTLINETISFVPDDPDNSDWAVVQEWLEIHS